MSRFNSNRRDYAVTCVLLVFVGLLLLSGTMGFVNNASYGQISQSLADQIGVTSSGSLIGSPINDAWAVKPDAGFFAYLPSSMLIALAWIMIVGLLGLVALGVKERSLAMTISPGIAYIVATTMIGATYFRVNQGEVISHPILVVTLMTGVGLLALTANKHYTAFVAKRTPNAMPARAMADQDMARTD